MGRFDNEISNPAVKTLQWKSKKQKFAYWDKDAEENVEVDLPLSNLIYLENYSSISGYDKSTDGGLWSNEIEDIKTQKLVVRNKEGILFEGLYADIKEDIKARIGKSGFTSAVYFSVGDEIWRILFTGGSLSGVNSKDQGKGKNTFNDWFDNYAEDYGKNTTGWMNFTKAYMREIKQHSVSITEALKATNHMGSYDVPYFQIEEIELSEDEENRVKNHYDDLKVFFKEYLKTTQSESSVLKEEKEEELVEETDLDDIFGEE